ncbi:MAG: response regulator [Patescibacteria group bacterium]|jgi:DNA-binding response OmpR family regulator
MAKDNNQGTILLVEDDTFLAGMYKTKFEMEGFTIITAEDGLKGFQLAKEKKPDIILLDILLPKMDGFEVLEKVRASKDTKDIPVIMLTNLGQKEDVKKGLERGANGYLIKAHFMPSEVVEKVKMVLKNSGQPVAEDQADLK